MGDLTNSTSPIKELIDKERERLNNSLSMIPSENYASKDVLEALGSVLTNKYSEGYPSKRYYGGNEIIDQIENLAIENAKKVFGAEHVNVQPYSGSPANLAVYQALLNPGDKVIGMNLAQGGHLTHGHKVNASGKLYNFVQYGVNKETQLLDYDEIKELARREKPKLIISGATAYPREIDFKQFHEIAQEVGAISMADISHIAGLIAGGVHQSPFPFTDVVTTTTHKTLRGPRSAMIMCKEEFAKKIDKAVFPGMQGGPHNNNIAGIAVCLQEAQKEDFKKYAKQIIKNAKTLAQGLMEKGFTLISKGTDNHLILIDLTPQKCTGTEIENACNEINLTLNKNMIPYDQRSPFDPSGIRLGTPALTTRGMKEQEMSQIARILSGLIKNYNDQNVKGKLRGEVIDLCKRFPVY